MIVKDEELYLDEFLCYYLTIGVDHFYIYDNGSAIPVSETLKPYSRRCTIIDFPGRARQLEAYNHFIRYYSHETDWVAPIDIDEFIIFKQDKNIKDFLKKYSHIDCIAINWKCFGDNYFDKRPSGLVMDNFVLCEDIQNPHIKNIVKSSAWFDCENMHYLGLKPGKVYSDVKGNLIASPFNENYTLDVVQMNHYVVKSREECYRKYQRGRASIDEKFNLTEELFESWRGSMNVATDTFLKDNFSQKVKAMMEGYKKNGLNSGTHLLQRIRKRIF